MTDKSNDAKDQTGSVAPPPKEEQSFSPKPDGADDRYATDTFSRNDAEGGTAMDEDGMASPTDEPHPDERGKDVRDGA